MLEAFEPAGGPSAVTAAITDAGGPSSAMNDPITVGASLAPASPAIAASRDPAITMSRDEAGHGITMVRQ